MSNKLHTVFCHKCSKFMNYPYEHKGELYHNWCLPIFFAPTFDPPSLARCEMVQSFADHFNSILISQDRKDRQRMP